MIIQYDNAISLENCGRLIALFEKCESLQERVEGDKFSWDELNLTLHKHRWEDLHTSLTRLFTNTIVQYITETGVHLPRPNILSDFRMKRYEGDDSFGLHSDVTNAETAKRYLAGILTLNETTDGEIEFPLQKLTVPHTPASLLLYPPNGLTPYIEHSTPTVKYSIQVFAEYSE
jgi:hypothetical protein